MLSTLTGQALSAKVKARFGKRLTEAQYNEMLHKRSVSEAAGWLKNQPGYSELLQDVQESAVHRGQLENILRREIFSQYTELLAFDFEGRSSYYSHRVKRMEIEQILKMIQALISGDIEGYVTQVPAFMSRYASFNFMGLSEARDFDSLLEKLSHTPYAALLRPLRPVPDRELSYPACEKALFTWYYEALYQVINSSFQGKTRDALLSLLSTNAQLTNLESIYRLKRYYGMTPEQIAQYILPKEAVNPNNSSVRTRLFRRLLAAQTPEEFLQIFQQSAYGKFAGDSAEGPDGLDGWMIEYAGQAIRYRFSIKNLYFSTSVPVIFTAYITLLEIEVQNLITIIEGIRYQVPADQIKKMIVLE